MTPPAVIGLDLSLTSTGLAGPGWTDRIRSAGRRADTLTQRRERLRALADQITARTAGAALVVVEAPAYSRNAGSMHDRSGLFWLVVDQLRDRGVPVAEVAPTSRARYATGKGNAAKDEVLAAAIRRYPDTDITANDVADAVILRAMGLDWLGHPPAPMPQTHRAALDSVNWPETEIARAQLAALEHAQAFPAT